MKKGTMIKLLEDVNCTYPLETSIPKYEVVTFIDQDEKKFLVRNIIDEFFIIPSDSLFRVLKKKDNFTLTKSQIYRLWTSLQEPKVSKVVLESSKKSDPLYTRAIQKMQIICSNLISTNSLMSSNDLLLASQCASMALQPNLSNAQINRLILLSTKMIAHAVTNE